MAYRFIYTEIMVYLEKKDDVRIWRLSILISPKKTIESACEILEHTGMC